MRNPFKRSTQSTYAESRKETAKWLSGRPERVRRHRAGSFLGEARRGQAWEDSTRDFGG